MLAEFFVSDVCKLWSDNVEKEWIGALVPAEPERDAGWAVGSQLKCLSVPSAAGKGLLWEFAAEIQESPNVKTRVGISCWWLWFNHDSASYLRLKQHN